MTALITPRAAASIAFLAASSLACLEPPQKAEAPIASSTTDSSNATDESGALFVYRGGQQDERGSGWASCEEDDQAKCDTHLESVPGAGVDGGVGLRFRARGTEWLGFGWNWFSWWPSQAGTDISERSTFTFSIRVSGKPGLTPEPFTVKIGLGGSARGGQDTTRIVALIDYAPDFADGHWHTVHVPLEALLREEGETFDTQRAWSFTVGAWNQGQRDYEIAIDEVHFE